jgi:hypothetical protein
MDVITAGGVGFDRCVVPAVHGFGAAGGSSRRCAELGSPLRVVASHREVLRLIEITGLDQKVVLVATVGDALIG